MAYKYVFTNVAANDLSNILNYISIDLSNPLASKKFYSKVMESINLICEFPNHCPIFQNTFVHSNNIRSKLIDNYTLFYEVDEQNECIIVLRIIYSKRNLEELLKSI